MALPWRGGAKVSYKPRTQLTLPMKVPKQDPLSQDLGQWLDEPQIAFDSWLARESASAAQARNFRNTSQTVYSSMWRHFMETLAARNIPLHRVTSEELQKFLQSLDANQEHRSRYHLLLGRVFAYLGELGLRNDSPRFGISEEDYATTCNAPMPFLSALQREELTDVAHVLGSREQDVSVTQSMALTLLLLGAGLKVGEALRCTVNCIDIELV
jgi:site-specific recombinase XerD